MKINAVLGSVIGDIIGSVYEFKPTKDYNFEMFNLNAHFTDDSVLTMSVAKTILEQSNYDENLRKYYNTYPDRMYGNGFLNWIKTGVKQDSYGNGAPMRISAIGNYFTQSELVLSESCDRLFVNTQLKAGILENELAINCRFCESQFTMPNNIEGGFSLQPQIIYPTFLKELSTSHFSNIWNNVSRDLSETKRVVFIGYSFQQADFEIRQLLARRLPDDCKIINVGNSPELNEGDADYFNSAQSRYKNFFGERPYQYYGCGAREFINNHLQEL